VDFKYFILENRQENELEAMRMRKEYKFSGKPLPQHGAFGGRWGITISQDKLLDCFGNQ